MRNRFGAAFLMDILTPVTHAITGRSQDNYSTRIPSTCATVNGNENICRPSSQAKRNSDIGGDGISLNARRLKLRNAGFRAALLPTRRLSPAQQTTTGIGGGGGVLVRSENIENTAVGRVKARHTSSPESTGPLNILREIRNCSQRRTVPQSPLGDIFGFADDENEDVNCQDHINTMPSRSGSIKASKTRKPSRRVSSFQSAKYIEYLESELGVMTKKLETLQSPETVSGQAAKIRKLEKRTQELSQHLADWEKNFEERVNDQVFERLYGESDLRLKILTLEQAAAHKETHIAELGKELEDAKAKVEEAQSIEATMSRRIDVLTELLAKSPTRTSSCLSTADFPTPVGPVKPLLHRLSMSPTRCSQRLDNFDDRPRIDSLVSPTNLSNCFNFQANGSASETDTESHDFNIFSRPASGIFSSRSSQTSSSRPTSMFSSTSVSAWTSADEKPVGRARKSRRFAPGSAGLKPLLLATNAGLQSPTRPFETPKKSFIESQSSNGVCWEFAEDLVVSTPSRPGPRRPYSWTYSPAVTNHTSILENEETNEDTLIADVNHDDDFSAYLRHLAAEQSTQGMNRLQPSSSPPPTGLSLYQELNTKQPFVDSSDNLDQVHGSPASAVFSQDFKGSPSMSMDAGQRLQTSLHEAADDSFVSEFSKTIVSSDLDPDLAKRQSSQPASSLTLSTNQSQTSHLAGLATVLGQKPLDLVRAILLRSWARGSTQLSQFVWRVMNMFLMPCKKSGISGSSRILVGTGTELLASNSTTLSGSVASTAVLEAARTDHDRNNGMKQRFEIAKLLSKLQAFAFPASDHRRPLHCSCCIEPPGKRSLKLWTKLVLALMVAVGCAMLEGPAAVLETEHLDRCATNALLPGRKDDE